MSYVLSTQIIPYAFPASRDRWNGLVLLGEAPGAEEERLEQPFVGRSGRLLNAVLEAFGIVRHDTLIANVFQVRPPQNNVGAFFIPKRQACADSGHVSKVWGAHNGRIVAPHYAPHLVTLAETLAQWSPRRLIALGATALWAATGQSVLKDALGATLPCRLPNVACPVRACWHPSFVLRGGSTRLEAWRAQMRAGLRE